MSPRIIIHSDKARDLGDRKSCSYPEECEATKFIEHRFMPLTCRYCDQALTPYAEYDILGDNEGYHVDCEIFDETVGTTCGICEKFISPFGNINFYCTSMGVIHDSCWVEDIGRKKINSLNENGRRIR